MSGGTVCKCEPALLRQWMVLKRKFNTSAFNGGKVAPSEYSTVTCGTCSALWRTKAKYVDGLPDAPRTNGR